MVENFEQENSEGKSRDAAYWAGPVDRLKVSEIPAGATNLNMDGFLVGGPLQGFGHLWQKTFTVRLAGSSLSPAEVIKIWKANFINFQPSFNRFYASEAGVQPGSLLFIDSSVPVVPNTPGVLPISTGVLVLYSDESSFTVMTPEGHPESGWNTFSAFYDEDGYVVAQIQSMTRSTDPIYEFGFRFMGGDQMQDKTWTHVLSSLARACGFRNEVEVTKNCIDPHLQWSAVKNVWKNAVLRTTFYKMATPLRWAFKKISH